MKKILLYIAVLFLPFLFFGQTKIKSFYFENDQSIPTPYSTNQLHQFKQSLKKGEINILEVYSYTDSIGSPQYNDTLAKKRLNYTANYLGLQYNSSVQLKSYGIDRRYDIVNHKNWRRVDIYYAQGLPPIANDSLLTQTIDSLNETTDIIAEITTETIINEPIEEIVYVPYILNVEFLGGTARMELSSFSEVKKLAEYLKEHPEKIIVIRGHVCCGNNIRISRHRARTVYRELIKSGIEKSRLDFVGMSNNEPLVFPEETAADRQRNRRVDVQFKQ